MDIIPLYTKSFMKFLQIHICGLNFKSININKININKINIKSTNINKMSISVFCGEIECCEKSPGSAIRRFGFEFWLS